MSELPRMDLLFVVPRLGGGGAERVFATLLRHLDRGRFRLALAIQHRDGEYMDTLPGDVEVLDLGPGHLRNRLPGLLALLWRRRPAVVFTTLGYVNLLVAAVRPLLPPGTVHVARETSIPARVLGGGPRDRIKSWLYRRRLPAVDLLICQSRDMVEDLIRTWGFPGDRAVVIHNPVDVDRIRALAGPALGDRTPSQEQVRLVAAGRLVPQKGFDLLLAALSRTPPRVHLTLLGEGPERARLEDQVRSLGLQDRVRMLPFAPNPYPEMARADAVVLSSRHEGFPNVLLEAAACGRPVIAFRCPGGIDEIILEGETGLMVPPEDVEALAEAMVSDRIRAMDPARIEAGIRGRFAPGIIVPRYEEALVRVARPRGLRRG